MGGASFMAISGGPAILATSTTAGAVASAVNVSYPSGGGSGDLVVFIACANNPSPVTWTPSNANERVDTGAAPSLFVGELIDAGGGSETLTGSASMALIGSLALRVVNADYDTIGTVATTTSDGTLTLPGITASIGLLVAIVVADQSGGGVSFTAPSGFQTAFNGYVSGMPMAAFYKSVAAGATGGIDATVSGLSSGTAAGVLLGLV